METGTRARNASRLLKRSLVVVSICFVIPCFILVVAELVVRLSLGKLTSTESPRAATLAELTSDQYEKLDRRLGWVPSENRSNGAGDFEEEPVIVAVGDSYTWGVGVEDHETWPAFLERLLGVHVENAGVGAYGFDQIVLRAEEIMAQNDVDLLIVGLITDDIARCEKCFKFGRWKPYFTVEDGSLVFHEASIGAPPPPPDSMWLDLLDHSYFAHQILCSALPADAVLGLHWFEPTMPTDCMTVARHLVARLSDRCARAETDLVIVLQGSVGISGSFASQSEEFTPLVEAATARGIPVLNLASQMAKEFSDEAIASITAQDQRHLSSAGNEWVASQIAAIVAPIILTPDRVE